jgi:hypothetical protein|tara:strand:+ start:330 stop:557 length:228 start_codon:yes stop_codon:yes gene_type:complete
MRVVIVYSNNLKSEAQSLKDDIKTKWSDAEVNLMGVYGKTDSFSRYQVQLERSILYHDNVSTDNTTIINLIEERL